MSISSRCRAKNPATCKVHGIAGANLQNVTTSATVTSMALKTPEQIAKEAYLNRPIHKKVAREENGAIRTLRLKKYEELCKKAGHAPANLHELSRVEASLSSVAGNEMETMYDFMVPTLMGMKTVPLKFYARGKELQSLTEKLRREVAKDPEDIAVLNKAIKELNKASANALQPAYVKEVLTTKRKISFPDSIAITEDNKLFLAEAKLGGVLDSKNLPKNIEELINSDGTIWREKKFSGVERAVFLTGVQAKVAETVKSRWAIPILNEKNKLGYRKWINVLVNQEIIQWYGAKDYSSKEYLRSFVEPVATRVANQMYADLHS